MWVRTLKITFANELMKKSVRSHLSDTIDLTEGMILVYRVDLASNVSLVNHFFPSKEALESFSEKLNRNLSPTFVLWTKNLFIEFSTLYQISLRIAMSEVKFLQTNQKLKLVPSPGEEEIVPLTFA